MKKTEIKKRRVIEESAKLFYFNGYMKTGLKEILEVCKIPKGSFYYYFKNKDDLLINVIDYHTNNIVGYFDKAVNDLSIPKFKVFFLNFFSNIEMNSYHGGSPLGNIANELSDVAYYQKINELKNLPHVTGVGKHFKNGAYPTVGTSNLFYIKLKQASDYSVLVQMAQQIIIF